MNRIYEDLVISKIEKLTERKVKDIKIIQGIVSYIPYGYEDTFNIMTGPTAIPIFSDMDKIINESYSIAPMVDTAFVQYEDSKINDESPKLKLLRSVITNAEIIYPIMLSINDKLRHHNKYYEDMIDALSNKTESKDMIVLGCKDEIEAANINSKLLHAENLLNNYELMDFSHKAVYRINNKYFLYLDNKMLEEYHKIPEEKLKYDISSINFAKDAIPRSFSYISDTLIYHNIVVKDRQSSLIGSKISDTQINALKEFNRKNMIVIDGSNIYLYNSDDKMKSAMKRFGYKLLDNNLLELNSEEK